MTHVCVKRGVVLDVNVMYMILKLKLVNLGFRLNQLNNLICIECTRLIHDLALKSWYSDAHKNGICSMVFHNYIAFSSVITKHFEAEFGLISWIMWSSQIIKEWEVGWCLVVNLCTRFSTIGKGYCEIQNCLVWRIGLWNIHWIMECPFLQQLLLDPHYQCL